MRTLVLDQSSSCTGFALVEDDPTVPVKYGAYGRILHHGRITTPSKYGLLDRLNILRADLENLLDGHYPVDEIVMENTQFSQRSSDGAGATGAVIRVIKDLAKKRGLAVYFQHPTTVKKCASGKGNADKDEMISAARDLWELPNYKIKDHNHADALCGAFVWLVMGDEIRAKSEAKNRRAG